VLALRGVDLELHPGELTLLVGPSGCGKTTLISILAGTLDPTGGEVSVLGVDLSRLPRAEKVAFRARHVGFVFQQFNLLPALTAAENVVDGTILQVNVRPGEYVATVPGQALVMMGSLRPLHVRVNIDEEDIPRLRLGAPARAKLRGDARQEEIPMTFARLEPYVLPKTSLTGTNIERVDTRVVQLVYAIDPETKLVREKKVLVGQLLDVFIDTHSSDPDGN
jgi:ABC-type Fe3+/spermidine/putrescine transport system ATPase subunit